MQGSLIEDQVELFFAFYIHAQVHRKCTVRYSAELLSNAFCEYFSKYQGPREVYYRCCERFVARIVEKHRVSFCEEMIKTCYKNVIHVPPYVDGKVAIRSDLPSTWVVDRVLPDIYRCDKSMRKINRSAYMKPQDCLGVCGIYPVYSNQEEGFRTTRYSSHHTNMTKKTLDGIKKRMADLKLQKTYYQHSAVDNSYSTFKLLVDYETNIFNTKAEGSPNCLSLQTTPSGISSYYYNLSFLPRIDIYEPTIHQLLWTCSREQPRLYDYFVKGFSDFEKSDTVSYVKTLDLKISGRNVPRLKQFCRKEIRDQLYQRFLLPDGIKILPIPEILKKYINFEQDF